MTACISNLETFIDLRTMAQQNPVKMCSDH